MKKYVQVALYSCLFNGGLMTAKYLLAMLSGSMALRADAMHSFADVISSFLVLMGILISDRKTETFPLGLYKVENLAAFFSSLFIFFAAYEIAHEALFTSQAESIQDPAAVFAGILVMMAASYLFSRYETKAGLREGSPSLLADAKHILTDMLSTLCVLVALLGTYFGYPLDKYAAVLVAVLVVGMGLKILIDSLKVLLDATLDYSTLNGIRKVLESHPLVKNVVSLGGRNSGRYKFVEVKLTVETKLLSDAHDVVSYLEEDVLDRWPDIDKILIHYEPEEKESIRIAVPVSGLIKAYGDVDTPLADHFGEAPFFAILQKDVRSNSVSFEMSVQNTFLGRERRKGINVAEMLGKLDIDEIYTQAPLDHKGAGYALEAQGIDIFQTQARTLNDLLKEITDQSFRPGAEIKRRP